MRGIGRAVGVDARLLHDGVTVLEGARADYQRAVLLQRAPVTFGQRVQVERRAVKICVARLECDICVRAGDCARVGVGFAAAYVEDDQVAVRGEQKIFAELNAAIFFQEDVSLAEFYGGRFFGEDVFVQVA